MKDTPTCLRMKTSNAFQMIGFSQQKQSPRNPFVSALTGIGRIVQNHPQVAVIRDSIKAARASRLASQELREINLALGGGHAGKIQKWGNGAISVGGKLTKNPLRR